MALRCCYGRHKRTESRGGVGEPTPPSQMKAISWNCRGLGNPRAVRALSRLIRVENPQLVFLMETRLKDNEMDRIRSRCGFNSCFSVACNGNGRDRAGGIALLWHDQVILTVKSFSLNHILCSLDDEVGGDQWFLSGIYGYPEEQN